MMGAIPTLGYKALIRGAILNPTALNVKGIFFQGAEIRYAYATGAPAHATRQPRPLLKLAPGHAKSTGAAITLRAN